MAKVYAFPQQVRLPDEIEEALYELGREYIKYLYLAMSQLYDDEPTNELLAEVSELAADAYARGVSGAIEELEEG